MAVEAVGVRLRRDFTARAMFVFTVFVRVSRVGKLSGFNVRDGSRA